MSKKQAKPQAATRSQAGRKQDVASKVEQRSDGRTPNGTFKPGVSGNRTGKRKEVDVHARLDAWVGRRTGIGIPGIDKGVDLEFCIEPVSDIEAAELWRGDDIVKRVIELPALEMYREGFECKTEDTDQTAAIMKTIEDHNIVPALRQAKMYERAYGGAAIFPILNDGERDFRKPLNKSRIREITALHVLEPSELDVVSWYGDIADQRYRRPEIFRLNPIAPGTVSAGMLGMTEIHESRLVVWPGVRVSHRMVNGARPGWGDSVLTMMKSALRGFNLAWGAISTLIADFAQAVIKMKGLAAMLAAGNITEVQARMRMVEISRSIARAVLIDADEHYERQSTNVSGLPDLADRVASRLAAAANMPLTRMMGQSPKGLGNEGDSDVTWWNGQISGLQEEETHRVRAIVDFFLLAKDGPTKGQQPKSLTLAWLPLDMPSEKEDAEARKVQAETDAIYIANQVLSPEDVLSSRFGGEEYSFNTTIDWEAKAAAEEEMVRALDERAAQKAAAAGASALPSAAGAGVPSDVPAPQTAFNGAQVASMVAVVTAAVTGQIPRESAAAILAIAFPITPENAQQLLGPVGWKPEPPPAAPGFGGGGAPFPPKAPEPEETEPEETEETEPEETEPEE